MNKNHPGDEQWRLESVSKQVTRSGRLKLLKSFCFCLGKKRKKRWIEVMNQEDKFLALLSSCLWIDILWGSLNLYMKRLSVRRNSSLSVSPLCKWKKQAASMFPANFCQLSERVEKIDCGLGRQV